MNSSNDILSQINNQKSEDKPFIQDFTFFKSRFSKLQKESKLQIKNFKENVSKMDKLMAAKSSGSSDDPEKSSNVGI